MVGAPAPPQPTETLPLGTARLRQRPLTQKRRATTSSVQTGAALRAQTARAHVPKPAPRVAYVITWVQTAEPLIGQHSFAIKLSPTVRAATVLPASTMAFVVLARVVRELRRAATSRTKLTSSAASRLRLSPKTARVTGSQSAPRFWQTVGRVTPPPVERGRIKPLMPRRV